MEQSKIRQMPVQESPSLIDIVWLGGILILATLLRLYHLNDSLWFDEVVTLVEFVRLPTEELVTTYHSLNNHLFFSLQAQLSVALFGEHPWALRLPAVLFGIASIWAVWRLAFDVAGRWPALFAALLVTVSYHHVWFSQNARGYTGLLFFALLATWLLVRAIERPRLGLWIGYGLCFAAAMYTHLSAAFFFAAHFVGYLVVVFYRYAHPSAAGVPSLRLPLIGCGIGVVITLILFAPIMEQMIASFTAVREAPELAAHAASIAEWESPLWLLEEIVAGFGPLGPLAYVVVPAVLVVMAIGGLWLVRTAAIVPLTLVLHVGVTVALLLVLGFRVWPRYFLTDIGLIAILLAVGAFVIGRWVALLVADGWLGKSYRLGMLFAAIGVVLSLALLPKNYAAPKQNYAGAAAYVNANKEGDAVVMTLGLGSEPFLDYYAPDWHYVDTLAQFDQTYSSGKDAWLVYTFPSVVEQRHADVLQAAAGTFAKEKYFPGTLNGGGIVVLRAEPKR